MSYSSAPQKTGKGRTNLAGPVRGAYITVRAFEVTTVSTETALLRHTFTQDSRLVNVTIRTFGSGTGTLTAFKVRRAIAGNTAVGAAGTQVLSADGGALGTQAVTSIEPAGTTPTLLAAQRDFTKGQQVGVFVTADAGTSNSVEIILTYVTKGHVLAEASLPDAFRND